MRSKHGMQQEKKMLVLKENRKHNIKVESCIKYLGGIINIRGNLEDEVKVKDYQIPASNNCILK